VRADLAAGFADGDAPGMWGAHHYAFHDGLPADKGFFTALESGQQLQGSQETQKWAPISH
jgi:hypothetical protein